MLLRLALALLFVSPATGQPTSAHLRASGVEPGAELAVGEERSRATDLPSHSASALLVSVGTTAGLAGLGALAASGDGALAAVLVSAGFAVGPSAGNLYLGETGDALTGLLIRTAGAGAMTYGLRRFNLVDSRQSTLDVVVLLAGTAAVLVGLGYDLRTQYVNGRAATLRVRPRGAGLALALDL